MKIALLTFSFPPETGGVENYLFELFSRMAKKHEMFVLTDIPVNGWQDGLIKRVHIKKRTAWHFGQALTQLKPDLVIAGHTHPQILLATTLYTRGSGVAFAYGNDYLAAQKRWHAPLTNWLLKQANPLITITQENAHRLHQLINVKPKVVYPGTDPVRFSPAKTQPEKPLTLLTVSRLVPRKGIDLVLQALPKLLQSFPALQYHIVGGGPDRERLENLVTELGIDSSVRFLGRVPDELLADTYRQADIFVMPVREIKETASVEGFGIVYIEASASGLPVVVGRSGGAVEAVRDEETGVIVPPNDIHALQETLTRLIADRSLRQKMGQAGRQWVETEMNWNHSAQTLAKILNLEVL